MKELICNFKLIWPYMKDEKVNIIKYIISSILAIIINIILPIISAQIIVNLTNSLFKQMIIMVVVLFLISNIKNFLQYMQTYYDINFYWNSYSKMQKKVNSELLKLSNDSLDKNNTGVFVERLTYDTGRVTGFLNVLTENIPDILSGIGILVAVLIIDRVSFIVILTTIILRTIIENKRATKVIGKDKEYRKKKEKNTALISEITHGIREIKMLHCEENFLNEMTRRIKDIKNTNYDKQDTDRKYLLLRNFLNDLFTMLLSFLLAVEVYNKHLTIAHALVIINYSISMPNFIISIGDLLDRIKDFNLSVNRVFSIINDDKFKKEYFGKTHLKKVKGNFEFKNVSFSYGDNKVLENINFKVNSKETVAFVGKSGSGKTTIFNLLCKMYNVDNGVIKIDNVDINELDKDSIRGNITAISQNPYIFNMTLRENFEIVKSDLAEEDMIKACKMACIHDFIMSLPDKYDTVVGEGGVNLSGGQKQRIAIARALIQDTEIILFDEATSALDNVTQLEIQKAINNLKNKYTILIIAHRLSTIKNVDNILFLNDGVIENSGTHEELLKKSKNYKKLYELEIKESK